MIKKVRYKILSTFCILLYFCLESYSMDQQLQQELDNNSTTNAETGDCSQPGIEQFPKPRMGQWTRKRGGILLHIFICVFCFMGQAVVCDFFVEALERICAELHLSSDVAGATFMAAASSAPELATVIIGVIVNEDDIGMSGVIGSAVFNVTVVIAVCVFAVSHDPNTGLDCWPITRDAIFYALSVTLMIIVVSDEKITWYDSLSMVLLYVGYCLFLWKNRKFEVWVQKKCFLKQGQCPQWKTEQSHGQMAFEEHPPSRKSTDEFKKRSIKEFLLHGKPQSKTEGNKITPKNCWERAKWYLNCPVDCMARVTMPDLKEDEYRNWYMYNFIMSLFWMAIYSYIMVWMITVIGYTLGIPDTVMGLTFIAAGVSVPDALTSRTVAKEGFYEMAISNAIGSNVFDVLICLGMPWFLKTAILNPGSTIIVRSKGLVYCTVSLLSTVLFLIVTTHCHGWKLSKGYAISLLVWYTIFIVFASLYELNILVPNMNPPTCPSSY